jgi:hypothetical protein
VLSAASKQEATMKASVRLLSWSLFAATLATGAFGATNETLVDVLTPGDRAMQPLPMVLAGANGHDTVGALMPLSLWPSGALHPHDRVPAKVWKRKSRPCCGTLYDRGKS